MLAPPARHPVCETQKITGKSGNPAPRVMPERQQWIGAFPFIGSRPKGARHTLLQP